MDSLKAGDVLDHYRIQGQVARSGMATIFRATDTKDGRDVAIKIPHLELESDPVFFDRFRREAEIGKELDHPGVMKVFDDTGHSQVYMAMEWVSGRLLRDVLLEKRRLPIPEAIDLTLRICDALEYIHSHGVIHRDLKPENIMMQDDGSIKIIDFGIAGKSGSRRLTYSLFSQSLGTPDYVSPEQVKGQRGDARSDIYAMGAMLYEMVTGQPPFSGANPFLVMNERLVNSPTPPRELNPRIPEQLQEVIYRALEREPRNRYTTAREFAWDLEHLDEVGVTNRTELKDWKKRRNPRVRQVLFYAGIAMIPVIIFVLLLLVARK